MGPFLFGICILLVGIGVGIPAFYHLVYQSSVLVPRLKKFRIFHRRDHLRLLWPFFFPTLFWCVVIVVSMFLVSHFFFAYRFIFFCGLLIALACAFIEAVVPRVDPLEAGILDRLKKDLVGPGDDPDGKYPVYTSFQMRKADWKTNGACLNSFQNLRWECSVCNGWNLFSEEKVMLHGAGMRFVLQCGRCGDHSIVRVSGFVNTRILTEAQLPEYAEKLPLFAPVRQEASGTRRKDVSV